VKEAHREARSRFLMWVSHGKPECGPFYNEMVDTRKTFKSKLRWCQKHQDRIRMDVLASHHAEGNFRSFWKSTNKLKLASGLPTSVDGLSNSKEHNIYIFIAEHFRDLFTVKSPLGVSEVRDDETSRDRIKYISVITVKAVSGIISAMANGKSPGHDSLSIEHLQHAGPHLARVLCLFFNVCLVHSYLPSDLMKTVIVPIVKNKTGDVSAGSNYRPISLATIVAKVFDGVLNAQLDGLLKLHDLQFGFKRELSTESAILTLKHTVKYYTDRRTPVYACFLDLSKAFDLVAYDILWEKVYQLGLPSDVINIFKFWYRNQSNCIRWAGECSDAFKMECGVRQGGLTSPKLFNLYINGLIEELCRAHVGCHLGNICVNNISYADDMVLLAPSVGALRKLLNICEKYTSSHGLLYNIKKSQYMIFKAGNKCLDVVPPHTIVWFATL
jgi:hypothetical protein